VTFLESEVADLRATVTQLLDLVSAPPPAID
jgi:hypothetical protein